MTDQVADEARGGRSEPPGDSDPAAAADQETVETTDASEASRSELLDEVVPVPSPETEEDVDRTSRREQTKIRTAGLAQFFGLRVTWSRWLIGWISVLILFQIVLTFAVGLGAVNFTGYDTFLGLTVGQNLVQVISLAIIVVRFLHSDKGENGDPPPV